MDEFHFPEFKIIKNVGYSVDTPLTEWINEDQYKLKDPDAAMEKINELIVKTADVAEAINAMCFASDDELIKDATLDNETRLTLAGSMAAEIAIILDGITEYSNEYGLIIPPIIQNKSEDKSDTTEEDCEECEFSDTCEYKETLLFLKELFKQPE